MIFGGNLGNPPNTFSTEHLWRSASDLSFGMVSLGEILLYVACIYLHVVVELLHHRIPLQKDLCLS